MPKASHATLILLSGLLWMVVGFFLMRLGLNLLNDALLFRTLESYPLLGSLTHYFGGIEQAAVALIVFSLLIGFIKGRSVMRKAADKGIARIQSLANPSAVTKIYNLKYCILLLVMIALGVSIKYFGVPNDIRGVIDTAVGAALINGSVVYLRKSLQLYKEA